MLRPSVTNKISVARLRMAGGPISKRESSVLSVPREEGCPVGLRHLRLAGQKDRRVTSGGGRQSLGSRVLRPSFIIWEREKENNQVRRTQRPSVMIGMLIVD